MEFDFDEIINRSNTNSLKWDFVEEVFSIKDVLPMWVADMDFKAPPAIMEAVNNVSRQGIFGYTGISESYYDSLKQWLQKRHNWEIKKEWVVFTPGVVVALYLMVKEFTKPGDNVIVQTPVYYPFMGAVLNGKCKMLDNALKLENSAYVMDLADLEAKINSRTKMIILCNPHNPVGRVWSKDELRSLGELCLKNDILVVSDEIHQDIIFDGFSHVSFASISKEFADNSITCTGVSKTFNLAGLQMANIIIPNPKLRQRFSKMVNSCGLFLPNIFAVAATEAAYRSGESWLEQLLKYLQGNLAFLNRFILDKIPGLKVIQPEGTYLVWLDFRECGINPEKLGRFVREDAKVALEAGTTFGCKEEGFERMNIACTRATLEEGLKRIEAAVNKDRGL